MNSWEFPRSYWFFRMFKSCLSAKKNLFSPDAQCETHVPPSLCPSPSRRPSQVTPKRDVLGKSRDGHGKTLLRVFFFTFFQRNCGIIISRGDMEIPNTAFESWDNGLSEKNFRVHQNILHLHNRPWISLVGPKKHFFRGLKTPKMAYKSKSRFFQSPRYQYPNPTTEKETSKQY